MSVIRHVGRDHSASPDLDPFIVAYNWHYQDFSNGIRWARFGKHGLGIWIQTQRDVAPLNCYTRQLQFYTPETPLGPRVRIPWFRRRVYVMLPHRGD